MQVGAAGAQSGHAALHAIAGDGSVLRGTAQLDQAELHIVHSEWLLRLGIEAMQRGSSSLDASARPVQRERGAAAGNRHVQGSLDLPQVGIERPA